MKLIAIQPLGHNRENARLWIESQRLSRLGFSPGTPIQVESGSESLTLRPAILAENHVSSRAVGHGFAFTVIDGTELKVPVIPKSYHKINNGPFVQTPFGPRLLRQSEIERIHGCALKTRHYSAAVQILGQGVLTRVFRTIFAQLASKLVLEKPR